MSDKLKDEYSVSIDFANGESPTSGKFNSLADVITGRLETLENAIGDWKDNELDSDIAVSRHQLNLSRMIGSLENLSPSYTDNVPEGTVYSDNPLHTIIVDLNANEIHLNPPASHPEIALAFSSPSAALQTLVTTTPSAHGEFQVINPYKIITYSPVSEADSKDRQLSYRFKTSESYQTITGATHTVIPTTIQFTEEGEGLVIEEYSGDTDYYRIPFDVVSLPYKWDELGNAIASTLRGSSSLNDSSNKMSYRIPSLFSGLTYGLSGSVDSGAIGDAIENGLVFIFDTNSSTRGVVEGAEFYMGRTNFELFLKKSSVPGLDYTNSARYLLLVPGNAIANILSDLYKSKITHDHGTNGGASITHSELVGLLPVDGKIGDIYSGPSTRERNDHPQYLNRRGYDSGDGGSHNNSMLGDIHMPSTTDDGLRSNPPYNYNQNEGISRKVTYGKNDTGVAHYGRKVGSDWRLQFRGDLDGSGLSDKTGLWNFSGANFIPIYVVTNKGHARDDENLRVFSTIEEAVSAANLTDYGVHIMLDEGIHILSSAVTISKPVTLCGSGRNNTVVSVVSGITTPFTVTSSGLYVDGLTFRVGTDGIVNSWFAIGGILSSFSNVMFTTTGTGEYQTGITLNNGVDDIIIDNVKFANYDHSSAGANTPGAIYAKLGAAESIGKISVEHCVFDTDASTVYWAINLDCSAGSGDEVYLNNIEITHDATGGGIRITGVSADKIHDNYIYNSGYGIYTDSVSSLIQNNKILGQSDIYPGICSATTGATISKNNIANKDIGIQCLSSNIIDKNTVVSAEKSIYFTLAASQFTVSNNKLTPKASGYGILCDATITSADILNNKVITGATNIVGMYVNGDMNGCSFKGNIIDVQGTCFYVNGNINNSSSVADAVISHNSLQSSTSGCILINGDLDGCTLDGNAMEAYAQGCIRAQDVHNCTFGKNILLVTNNSATTYCLYVYNIYHTTLTGNTLKSIAGSPLLYFGGVANRRVDFCTFSANTFERTTNTGQDIAFDADVNYSTFTGNTFETTGTTGDGNVVDFDQDVTGCTFLGNTCSVTSSNDITFFGGSGASYSKNVGIGNQINNGGSGADTIMSNVFTESDHNLDA